MTVGAARATMLGADGGGIEVVGDTAVGPTVIDTSSTNRALRFCNGRHIDRTGSDRLWAGLHDGTDLLFWYSDDDGSTWTENTSAAISGVSDTNGWSFFIDVDDHAHVIYSTGSQSAYRRMASIGTTTSWSSEFTVDATYDEAPDIVAFRDGASWIAAVVASNGISSEIYIVEDVDGTPSIAQTIALSNFKFPSLDFHHTGDSKTIAGSAPHVYVSGINSADLLYAKLTYSGGTWTEGTNRTLDSSGTKDNAQSLIYDGTRIVVAYAESTAIYIAERDEADTTTTLRTPTALSDGAVLNLSVTYDQDENIHLWAVGGTSEDVKRIVYDRSAGTWDGSWTTVLAGTVKEEDSLTLKRGYSNGTVEGVFLDGSGSPYDVTFAGIT